MGPFRVSRGTVVPERTEVGGLGGGVQIAAALENLAGNNFMPNAVSKHEHRLRSFTTIPYIAAVTLTLTLAHTKN